MDGLTKNFNFQSIMHGPIMWIAMFGVGMMMFAPAAAAGANPTIIDGALSVLAHLAQGVVHLFSSDGFSTMGTMLHNTFQGNILPNHLNEIWGMATSGASHGAAATAGHLHGAATAAVTNQWQWFGGLTEVARNSMVADAAFYGVPLDQYIADWCAQKGLQFTP